MIINNNQNISIISKPNILKLENKIGFINSDKSVNNFFNAKRFDIIEIEKEPVMSEEAKELKERFIKDIRNSPLEERNNISADSYVKMQSMLIGRIESLSNRINKLSEYQEERAYYQQLKENDGIITESKFNFKNYKIGDTASKNYLEHLINENKSRIDDLLNTKVMGELENKIFKIYAKIFSAATGKYSEILDFDYTTLNVKLTEENFVSEVKKILKL